MTPSQQAEEMLRKLEKLRVEETCEVASRDKFSSGIHYAAKFSEDGLYYRCKIVGGRKGDVVVRFIDYGNKEVVSKLYLLPESLSSLTPLAVQVVVLRQNCMYCFKGTLGWNEWSS